MTTLRKFDVQTCEEYPRCDPMVEIEGGDYCLTEDVSVELESISIMLEKALREDNGILRAKIKSLVADLKEFCNNI